MRKTPHVRYLAAFSIENMRIDVTTGIDKINIIEKLVSNGKTKNNRRYRQ